MTILSDLAMAVDKALTVLTYRVLTVMALWMTFGLFSWAMYLGTWIHFAIAGAFGVVIFLPVLMGDKRPEAVSHEVQ